MRTPGEHRKTLNIGKKNINHHRFMDLAVATALVLVAIIDLLEHINRATDFVLWTGVAMLEWCPLVRQAAVGASYLGIDAPLSMMIRAMAVVVVLQPWPF